MCMVKLFGIWIFGNDVLYKFIFVEVFKNYSNVYDWLCLLLYWVRDMIIKMIFFKNVFYIVREFVFGI